MPDALLPIERFMRHVQVNPVTGCWVWTSTTAGTKSRYPTFRPTTKANDPKVYAHRWAFRYFVGPIPDGYEVDHIREAGCVTTLCVKAVADEHGPPHLEAITSEENQRRQRLEVCRSGRHDLSDSVNVRWDSRGRRRGCKPCWLERARIRYHARQGRP